jgi:multidrug efflux pump subunit AcrA (membrane-fusion protein)
MMFGGAACSFMSHPFYSIGVLKMSLQDTIATDQAAVASAQEALTAAQAQLDKDQAELAAVQPHLTFLGKIEAEIGNVSSDVADRLRTAAAEFKAVLGL